MSEHVKSLSAIANNFEQKLKLAFTDGALADDKPIDVSQNDKKKAKALKKAAKADKKASKAVAKAKEKKLAVDDPEAYKVLKADKKKSKSAKKAEKAEMKAKKAAAEFDALCK